MHIKCIAIDDEPLAVKQIKDYASKIPFLDLEATFNNAIDPISYLKEHDIQLIFLDIEMEDFTGIQFIKTLKDPPKIILTTAYDSYAIEAFDLEVVDYLFKPISFERFLQAVDRAYVLISPGNNRSASGNAQPVENAQRNYIFVKTDYKIQKIDLDDILFIEGQKEYLGIHTAQGKILTLMNFKKMGELLNENFIRIHNSYIVAIDKIESIEKLRVKIGEVLLPISDTYKESFFNRLQQ